MEQKLTYKDNIISIEIEKKRTLDEREEVNKSKERVKEIKRRVRDIDRKLSFLL